jgi:transposase InsO family protein
MIDELKKAHSIRMLCSVLEVSRSSYYAGRRTCRARIDPAVMAAVREIHRRHRRSYGTRRMAAELRGQGHAVGRHRARTLMRQAGVWADVHRRHCYRPAGPPARVAPNHLNRQFNPAAPNTVWVGDITYLPTPQGWLYLAIVVDLYARRIVGRAFSTTPDTALVQRALEHAWNRRHAGPGLIFHSDQGCQYTSVAFGHTLDRLGIIQSMSRRGCCWDNAVVERVFRSLKHEWLKGRTYRDRHAMQADVEDFVTRYYNHRRRHTAIGNLPPAVVDALAA